MSIDTLTVGPAQAPARHTPLLLVLAWQEARRMLRSPWLLLGVALTCWLMTTYFQGEDWNGAQYLSGFFPSAGIQLAAAVLVALAFHRERVGLAPDAPVGETARGVGRLLAAVPLVGLAALSAAWLVGWVWSSGGVDLGDEPGRTLHAHFTLGEILQPVAAAVLAVATGAAAGRRFRHRATAILTLFIGWYLVTAAYWLFQASWMAPFTVLQTQPIYVDLGPGVNPNALPADWLLAAPTEYQENWARLVVSPALAWWHDLWLLGLAAVVLSLAFPAPLRRRLALVGSVVATVAVVAQFVVYPS